ncbi:VOC family protein [uncultured Paludibaculum sp.]|uniref:VOC family protein n=1 Tax=uncultured Paludibaculum sp. TaxID=1765020 RepID=UPI002AAAED0E|nr:VOC family protein [uncultured Paludibaculum sp.]
MIKPITWFEIPALDLPRAKSFYEQILAVDLRPETMDGTTLAIFPCDREHATGGCLVQGSGYTPSRDGAVLYVNAGEELDPVLNRVANAGGSIALPRTALPPGMGFYAHIIDSEGNRVGLHAAR